MIQEKTKFQILKRFSWPEQDWVCACDKKRIRTGERETTFVKARYNTKKSSDKTPEATRKADCKKKSCRYNGCRQEEGKRNQKMFERIKIGECVRAYVCVGVWSGTGIKTTRKPRKGSFVTKHLIKKEYDIDIKTRQGRKETSSRCACDREPS